MSLVCCCHPTAGHTMVIGTENQILHGSCNTLNNTFIQKGPCIIRLVPESQYYRRRPAKCTDERKCRLYNFRVSRKTFFQMRSIPVRNNAHHFFQSCHLLRCTDNHIIPWLEIHSRWCPQGRIYNFFQNFVIHRCILEFSHRPASVDNIFKLHKHYLL